MDVQLKRGLLEVCVLAVLTREDSYGYQIIKDVGAAVEISESTLYPILKRLESGQYLTVYTREYGGRLRKYYRITETGRQRIAEFQQEWKEILAVYRFITAEKEEERHAKT